MRENMANVFILPRLHSDEEGNRVIENVLIDEKEKGRDRQNQSKNCQVTSSALRESVS